MSATRHQSSYKEDAMNKNQKIVRMEDGRICVKNLSAHWLPELTFQREIGGTIYSVTGTYDGTEPLDRKLERIMGKNIETREGRE